MKKTIRQIFEETGTYMWFAEEITNPNATIHHLPLKK